ncbi:MAG: DUF5686 and carboxypeptidase regulatory-like domain-containing protein [Tannerella sp.]|jgi:hypothetical protein|nr:DUF5686 and carboxypeptidase regulatory-like domain-containing protein [Tannerella sp.]
MRLSVLILTGALLAPALSAQILTGRIVDVKGRPVPNATFYIRELTLGLMADERGEFRAKTDEGEYTGEASSLGYERKTVTFTVPAEGLALHVELREKTYAMREVVVTPGKEDPAYRIMRNVIAHAPRHLHQVQSYSADVYLKGTFKAEKVPALIKMQIKEKDRRNLIGKLFLIESQNEIRYRAPDRYEQRVVAISSTIPDGLNLDDRLPLGIVTSNIYRPSTFGGLLAPGSFAAYKFRLEDSYDEDGHAVHRIRVQPKKRNGPFVSGLLHIVDDTWSVRHADLSYSQAGVTIHFKLSYHETNPGVFLPATFDIAVGFDIMGMKAGGQFYASTKYSGIETDGRYIPSAGDSTTVTATAAAASPKTLTRKQQKERARLEELADKDRLTTREAYRMARLMEKAVEPEEVRARKRSLELRPLDSIIISTRDSLAPLRDSAYWAEHRNLPLRGEELQSYARRDSLRKTSGAQKPDSLNDRSASTWLAGVLLGEKINTGRKTYLKFDGLPFILQGYNFVDGFRLGQRVEAGTGFDGNRSLSIAPAVYYTTARREADVTVDGTLAYAPMRNGRFAVSAGNATTDFAGTNGTGCIGNTLGSVFFALNTAKFYQRRYLSLGNRIDIASGLILDANFSFEKRNDLENNTSYSFFGGRPASNRPHGQTDAMPRHRAFTVEIMLEYTPRHYFSVWKGKKIYRHSACPTIRLGYGEAIRGDGGNNSSFRKTEATIFQNIRTGFADHLFYELNAGLFLSARQTYLPDYKHFRTTEMFFGEKSLSNSFILLENYRYATNNKWLQAHAAYTSDYLLIKQIPFMQGYLLNEALHLRALWLPHTNHCEAGYSIGLGELGRIGVFAGFDGLKYKNTGFTVSIPLSNFRRQGSF